MRETEMEVPLCKTEKNLETDGYGKYRIPRSEKNIKKYRDNDNWN